MALATLTKGPVGLLPLLVIVPYVVWTRQWSVIRECRPVAGTLVLLAIAAPWYSAMFLLHGAGYADSARGDTITRFFSVIGGHGGTVLFYVPILALGFFPWSGFLPAALVQALRGSRSIQAGEGPACTRKAGFPPPAPTSIQIMQRNLQILCAVWVLALFLFFTLSSTRLPHYIAPLFPAAALLVAASWDHFLAGQAGRATSASLWLTLGIGCVLGMAFVSLEWAYDRFNPQIVLEFPSAALIGPGWAPTAVGFMILGGMGIFGYVAMSGERPGLSCGIASGLMVGVAALIITVALPRFQRYFIAPPQELATIAGLNLEPTDTLIAYGRPKPSLVFYTKRRCDARARCVEFIKPGEESQLGPLLDRPGQIMVLTQERLRAQLPPPASTYPIVLSRHGHVLLAKKPML
jgi:4-amino-4-deoxy-L-arabinose transferase-like glycosyltransferase